jgi:CheY-like chemotaxis protein
MRYEQPDQRSVTIALPRHDLTNGRMILHGTITQVCAATRTVVVAVDTWPLQLAVSLPETASLAPSEHVEVMVVDRDLARRTRVAAAFRAEGCHVVETGSPLETIDGLVDAGYVIDIIAVADTEPESTGIELRDYLDTAHRDALVVAIGDPEWTPSRTRIDATETQHLLRAGVQSLLLQCKGDRARASRLAS